MQRCPLQVKKQAVHKHNSMEKKNNNHTTPQSEGIFRFSIDFITACTANALPYIG